MHPAADSPPVTIKLTAPTAAAKAEFDTFSPTGDSTRNTVTIYQDTSAELFWTGTFKDATGKDVKTLVWRGRADDKFEWDGRGDDGRVLPDGVVYLRAVGDGPGGQYGNVGSDRRPHRHGEEARSVSPPIWRTSRRSATDRRPECGSFRISR